MHFVYFLVCLETGRTYVGQTDNLIRRYHLHVEGSTRTTREKFKRPVMIYWEVLPNRVEATRKERYYKSGSGHRPKCAMISGAMRTLYPEYPGAVSARKQTVEQCTESLRRG